MIDKMELRLGNWVYYNLWGDGKAMDWLKISGITKYGIESDITSNSTVSGVPFDKLLPVPLTPERLINYGFEKEYESNEYNKDGVKLWSKDEGGFYHINNELLTHIDTVHILQNWYYFNVLEELEITL